VLEWHYHAIQAGEIADAYQAIFSTGLIDQLKQWNEFTLYAELCENIHSKIQSAANPLANAEWIHLNHKLGVVYFLLGEYAKSIEHLQSALNMLTENDPAVLRARLLIDLSESVGMTGDPAPWSLRTGIAAGADLNTPRHCLCLDPAPSGGTDPGYHRSEQARTLYETHKQLRGSLRQASWALYTIT
jgi:tetratricopeptide (TPR) repeat protein